MTGATRLRDHPGLVIALLALVASITSLGNGYVYDDIPIILQNRIVQNLGGWERVWTSPYWLSGLLYRPVTVQLFAVQWALGKGSPLVFHATSVLLMTGVAFLFWRLAARLLPPWPALAAAALFAVHPVHVESVANVVGQAELLASGLALFAVERYSAWRAAGALTTRQRFLLAFVTLVAILSKETGYVIPPLLAAAEVLLFRNQGEWRPRLPQTINGLYPQAVAVAAGVLLRIAVLGPTTGAGPSEAFNGLTPWARVVGMLSAVPEWFRLILWPAHLQGEYGPPGIPIDQPFGLRHLAGAVLLLGAALLLIWAWRRRPAVGFGLAWVGLALFPVSNLIAATGVVVAERTLFLPSAGAMLAIGGLLAILHPALERRGGMALRAAFVFLALLIGLGAIRSGRRQLVWRDSPGFFRALEVDASQSYRAHLVAAMHYAETNRLEDAERAARRSLELFRKDPQVFEHLGQNLRRLGRCRDAIPVLADAVEHFPDRTIARSRLVECALTSGDTTLARRVAREGVDRGQDEFKQTLRRLGEEPR